MQNVDGLAGGASLGIIGGWHDGEPVRERYFVPTLAGQIEPSTMMCLFAGTPRRVEVERVKSRARSQPRCTATFPYFTPLPSSDVCLIPDAQATVGSLNRMHVMVR